MSYRRAVPSSSTPNRSAKKQKTDGKSAALVRHIQRIARMPLSDACARLPSDGETLRLPFANVDSVLQAAYKGHFHRAAGDKPGQALTYQESPSPFIFGELRWLAGALLTSGDNLAHIVDVLIAAVLQEGIGGAQNIIAEVCAHYSTAKSPFTFPDLELVPTQAHPTLFRLLVAVAFDAKAPAIPFLHRIVLCVAVPLLASLHCAAKPDNESEMHAVLEGVFAMLAHYIDGILEFILPASQTGVEIAEEHCQKNWREILRAVSPLARSHRALERRMAANVLAGVLRKVSAVDQAAYLDSLIQELSSDAGAHASAAEPIADAVAHCMTFCMHTTLFIQNGTVSTDIIRSAMAIFEFGDKTAMDTENTINPLEALTEALARVPACDATLFGASGGEAFAETIRSLCAASPSGEAVALRRLRLCQLLLEQKNLSKVAVDAYMESVIDICKGTDWTKADDTFHAAISHIIGAYPMRRHAALDSDAFAFLLENVLPHIAKKTVDAVVSDGKSPEFSFLTEIATGWVAFARFEANALQFAKCLLTHLLKALAAISEAFISTECISKTALRKTVRERAVHILAMLVPRVHAFLETDCVVRAREDALPQGKWLLSLDDSALASCAAVRVGPTGASIVLPEAVERLIFGDGAQIKVKPSSDSEALQAAIFLISASTISESSASIEKENTRERPRSLYIDAEMHIKAVHQALFVSPPNTEVAFDRAVNALFAHVRGLTPISENTKPAPDAERIASGTTRAFLDVVGATSRMASDDTGKLRQSCDFSIEAFRSIRVEVLILFQRFIVPWLKSHKDSIDEDVTESITRVMPMLLRHPHPNIRHLALQCVLALNSGDDLLARPFLDVALEIDGTNALYIDELHAKKEAMKVFSVQVQHIAAQGGDTAGLATRYCIGLAYSKFRETFDQTIDALRILTQRQPREALPILWGHIVQCLLTMADSESDTSVLPVPWRENTENTELVYADPAVVLKELFKVAEKGFITALSNQQGTKNECVCTYYQPQRAYRGAATLPLGVCDFLEFVRIFHLLLTDRGEALYFVRESDMRKQTKERLEGLARCVGSVLGVLLKRSQACVDALWKHTVAFTENPNSTFEQTVCRRFELSAKYLVTWSDPKIQRAGMEALASLEVFPYRSAPHMAFLSAQVDRQGSSAKVSKNSEKSAYEGLSEALAASRTTKETEAISEDNKRFIDAYFESFGVRALNKAAKSSDSSFFAFWLESPLKALKDSAVAHFVQSLDALDEAERNYCVQELLLPHLQEEFGGRPLSAAVRMVWAALVTFRHLLSHSAGAIFEMLIPDIDKKSSGSNSSTETHQQAVSVILEACALFHRAVHFGEISTVTEEDKGAVLKRTQRTIEKFFERKDAVDEVARHIVHFILRESAETKSSWLHSLLTECPALSIRTVTKPFISDSIASKDIVAQLSLYRKIVEVSQSDSAEIRAYLQRSYTSIFSTFEKFLQISDKSTDAQFYDILEVFAQVTFHVAGAPGASTVEAIQPDTMLTFLLTFCKEATIPVKVPKRAVHSSAVRRTLAQVNNALRLCHIFTQKSDKQAQLAHSYAHLFSVYCKYTAFEGSLEVSSALDEVKRQIVATFSILTEKPSFEYGKAIEGLLTRLPADHRQKPLARDILTMNIHWERLCKHFQKLSADTASTQGEKMYLHMTVQTIFYVMHSGHTDACTFASAAIAALLRCSLQSENWTLFRKSLLAEEILPVIRKKLSDTNGTVRTNALAMLGAFAGSAAMENFPAYKMLRELLPEQKQKGKGSKAAPLVSTFELLSAPQIAEITKGLKRIQEVTEQAPADNMKELIAFSDCIVPFVHASILAFIQKNTQGYFLSDTRQKGKAGAGGIFDKTTQMQFVTALLQTMLSFTPAVGPRHSLAIGKLFLSAAEAAHAHNNAKVCETVCGALMHILNELSTQQLHPASASTVSTLHFLQRQVIPKVKSFLAAGKSSKKAEAPESLKIRGNSMKLLLLAFRVLSKVPSKILQNIKESPADENQTIRTMRAKIDPAALSADAIRQDILELMTHVVAKLRSKSNGKMRERARRALKSFVLEFRDMHIFGDVLKAMCATLRDGYQLHVLSYSIVDLLAECHEVIADGAAAWRAFEAFAPDIFDILFTHYFGLIGEEKKRIQSKTMAKKRTAQDDHTEMRRNRCLEGVELLLALAADTADWTVRVEQKIRYLFDTSETAGSQFLKSEKRPTPDQALITASQKFLEAAALGAVKKFEKSSEKLDASIPVILAHGGAVFGHNLAVNDAIGAQFEEKFARRGILQNLSHTTAAKHMLPENIGENSEEKADTTQATADGLILDGSYAQQFARTFSIQEDVQRRDVDFASTPVLRQNTQAIVKSILQKKVQKGKCNPDSTENEKSDKNLSFANILTMELITEFHVLLSWKLFPFVEAHGAQTANSENTADPRRAHYDPLLGAVTALLRKNTRETTVIQCLKFFSTVLNFSKKDTHRTAVELYPSFENTMQPILDGIFGVLQRGTAIRRDCYKALTTFVRFVAASYALSSKKPFAIPKSSVAVLLTSVHSNLLDTKESLLHSGLALVKELLAGILKQIRYETAHAEKLTKNLMPTEMVDIIPPVLQTMLHSSDGGVQNRCLSIVATFVSDYVLDHGVGHSTGKAHISGDSVDFRKARDLLTHIMDTLLSHIVRYDNAEAKANVLRLLNVLLRRLPLDILQSNTKILLPILARDVVAATTAQAARRTDSRSLFPEKSKKIVANAAVGDAASESALALQALCGDRDCWTICVKDMLLAWLSQDVSNSIDVLTTACAVFFEVLKVFPEQMEQDDEACVSTKATAQAGMVKCASKVISVLENIAEFKKNPQYAGFSNHALVYHVLRVVEAMDMSDALVKVHFGEKSGEKSMQWHILERISCLADSARPAVHSLLVKIYSRPLSNTANVKDIDAKAFRAVQVGLLAVLRANLFEKSAKDTCVEALMSHMQIASQSSLLSLEKIYTGTVDSLRKAALLVIQPIKQSSENIDSDAADALDLTLSAFVAIAPTCHSGKEVNSLPVGMALQKFVGVAKWVFLHSGYGHPDLHRVSRDTLKALHGMALPVAAKEGKPGDTAVVGDDGVTYTMRTASFPLLPILAKAQHSMRARSVAHRRKGAQRHSKPKRR